MKFNQSENKNSFPLLTVAISAVITIVMLAYYIPNAYGLFFPQDEFGYFNNAAKIIGIDWANIAENQANYAYGYSVLLAPLMLLFKNNPVLLYRIAIAVNGLLLITYTISLHKLICKLFAKLSDLHKTFLALICTFAPYVVCYMHYTIAEVLIHVLFVMLLNQVYDMAFEADSEIKKNVVKASILCLALLLVHYRTIGLVAAFIIVIATSKNKPVNYSLYKWFVIIVCTISIFAGLIIVSATGYFSISKLFSLKNIVSMIFGILGKIYYAFVATFGFGLIGMVSMMKSLKGTSISNCQYEKKCEDNAPSIFLQFFLLSFAFLCIISSYFFIDGIRYDQLIYGRYIEMFLPILMCFGINEVIEKKMDISKLITTIIVMGLLAVLISGYAYLAGLTEYLPNFVSGISWIFGTTDFSILWLYIKPLYVAAIVLFASYLLISRKKIEDLSSRSHNLSDSSTKSTPTHSMSAHSANFHTDSLNTPVKSSAKPSTESSTELSHKSSLNIVLIVLLILSLFSSIRMLKSTAYYYQAIDKSDYELVLNAEKLMKNKLKTDDANEQDIASSNLIFLNSPFNNYVNLFQFWLMDENINLVEGLCPDAFNTPKNAIVVTYANYEAAKHLQEEYSNCVSSSHFTMYFND